MDRPEIYQRVIDALGKILVDKAPIENDVLMTDLALDKQDFDQLFSDLQSDFGIVMPPRLKSELSQLMDNDDYRDLTLDGFVGLISSEMKDKGLLKR